MSCININENYFLLFLFMLKFKLKYIIQYKKYCIYYTKYNKIDYGYNIYITKY